MIAIPNPLSVAKTWQEFDENGHLKLSSGSDRIPTLLYQALHL